MFTRVVVWFCSRSRSQAVISAQLVLGNDLTTMDSATRELLMSPGYVLVNQDELGVPGRLLRTGDRNSAELWGKPLADRSFACVLWYRNQTMAIRHRESKRLHSGNIERACAFASQRWDQTKPACFFVLTFALQLCSHRSALGGGRICLVDFRDVGFEGSAEIVDVWSNSSLGVFSDIFDWAPANSTADLGAAEFVYVRPVEGASRPSGCSAWGGSCSTAATPNRDGMFWDSS